MTADELRRFLQRECEPVIRTAIQAAGADLVQLVSEGFEVKMRETVREVVTEELATALKRLLVVRN